MDNDGAIIGLLTEIRDNQREEIAWRKRTIEESVALQRTGLRWQRIALAVVGLAIVVVALLLSFVAQHIGR